MCKWRKRRIGREVYLEVIKKLKEHQIKKREEKRKEKDEELRSLFNSVDVWKYINRKRSKKTWSFGEVGLEKCDDYFIGLLDGIRKDRNSIEMKSPKNSREDFGMKEGKEEENDISREEIYTAVERMEKKEAPGIDGILIDAWMFGEEAVKEEMTDLMQKIWKEGNISKERKKSIIVPVFK